MNTPSLASPSLASHFPDGQINEIVLIVLLKYIKPNCMIIQYNLLFW